MGLFDSFRRKKVKPSPEPQAGAPDEPPPPFAPFFKSAADYDRFDSAVRAYFKQRGHGVLISGLGLRVAPRRDGKPSPFGDEDYGLENLGQVCARQPAAEWPTLIAAHFDRMTASGAAQKTNDSLTWSELQPRLGIRLMEVADHALFEFTLWREDLPGIASMVFVDEPEAISSLKRDRVAELGVLPEHVFDQAFKNLDRLAPVKRSAFPLEDGNQIVLLEGESPFAAAHAVHLDRHRGILGKHGAFLAVPTRNCVLVLPFNTLDVIAAIPHLLKITALMHREGPGSVSTNVYWLHDGAHIPLPYELTDDKVVVKPPDELTSYLNSLAENEEST